MSIQFELIPTNPDAFLPAIVKKTDENGGVYWVPIDPANSDYQAYLATLAANSAPQANSTES